MKKGLIVWAVLMAFGLMAGCATMPPRELDELQANAVSNAQPVRLAEGNRERVDSFAGMMSGTTIRSGEILARIFTGDSTAKDEIEIVSTAGDANITDLGFTAVYTFRIVAVLRTKEGKNYPLNATGTDRQHGMLPPHSYAQKAVENAAIELAKQIRALTRESA